MFSFFRRYQRLIFLVVTSIIILSFSFFGTYSAMVNNKVEDPVLFTSLQGHKVKKSECMAYMDFLGISSAGNFEHRINFFNDGFFERDILSSSVGESIFTKWNQQDSKLYTYLMGKKTSESSFRPYQHPKAAFLSMECVWSYFAPGLKETFLSYQQQDGHDALHLFREKANLFVESARCPGPFVRELLLQQERKVSWIEPDPTLASRDLSLFGYQSATDWFGEEYMQHVVETVIDGADFAEKEGVRVSDDEVLAALYHNVKQSALRYTDLQDRSLEELLSVATRTMGLDFATIKHIEKTLLLFRRGYTDLGDHLAVSAFPFRRTLAEEARSRTLEVYALQPALRVRSTEDMGELYLWKQAVVAKSDDPLAFSTTLRSAESVASSFPEFVQERFLVSYRLVGPEQLEPMIRLKDLWIWQGEEKNFASLSESFPRLLEEKAISSEERLRAIESLPSAMRLEVDKLSKKLFVKDHSEWVKEEMAKKSPEEKVLFFRPRGEMTQLEGLSSVGELSELLRTAPLNEPFAPLSCYSQDGEHFYEFVVLDRSKELELVPLIQLKQDGTLSKVLRTMLETQYPSLRKSAPKQFLQEGGEWKPFSEVRSKVLDLYLASLFAKLDILKVEMEKARPSLCQWSNTHEARLALFTLPLVLQNVNKLNMKEEVVASEVSYDEILKGSREAIERANNSLFSFTKSIEKIQADELKDKPQFAPLFDEKGSLESLVVYLPKVGTAYVVVTGKNTESFSRALRSTLYSLDAFLAKGARRERIEKLLKMIPSGKES